MNDYFNPPDSPVDFTRARADAIRLIFAAVAAGFDLLPSRDALLQGRVNFAEAGGTGNALTATYTVPPEAYVDGATYRLLLTADNSGASTLNVNALGVKQILDANGVALIGGELVTGHVQDFIYFGGSFHLPAPGPRGPQGVQGASGGLTLLNGAGVPGGGTGSDGDFYIRVIAGVPTTIYGPKAAGVWPAGVSILGTDGIDGIDGIDGNTILNGAGDPAGGNGVNGDFWINTTTWTIFGPKAAGAWPAGHTIMDLTDLVLTGANTVNPDGTAYEIGFRDLPKSRTVSANFTLAAADRGRFIEYNDTGDTCTVPLNGTVAIGIGAVIEIVHTGSGTLTIAREAGVTMKLAGSGADANRSLSVGGTAWLHKINTNTWFISGAGVS
jgi:hypothetical protein